MSKNSYLCSHPFVPDFIDLADATVSGIDHPEFSFFVHRDDEGPKLVMASGTRRHRVRPAELTGRETPFEILDRALAMIRCALGDDAAYRFRFKGVPVFARGEP